MRFSREFPEVAPDHDGQRIPRKRLLRIEIDQDVGREGFPTALVMVKLRNQSILSERLSVEEIVELATTLLEAVREEPLVRSIRKA